MREGGHRPEVLAIDNNIVAPLIGQATSLILFCGVAISDFCGGKVREGPARSTTRRNQYAQVFPSGQGSFAAE